MQICVFTVGGAWRIIGQESILLTEGTSFLRLPKPSMLVAELEAFKSGMLAALRFSIRRVKILTNSKVLVSMFMEDNPLSKINPSDMSTIEFVIELNRIKGTFQSFDMELVSFNYQINDLQIMIDNNIVNFHRKNL